MSKREKPDSGGLATELRNVERVFYLVAAFFLRVRTALRLAAGLRRLLPLPLAYHCKKWSSSESGNESFTLTVPLGAVSIDLIFTGIRSPSLVTKVSASGLILPILDPCVLRCPRLYGCVS